MSATTPTPRADAPNLDELLGSIDGSADRKLAARLLQIDADAEYSDLIDSVLPGVLGGACRVERVEEIADGIALLDRTTYDGILLSCRACDDDAVSAVDELLRVAPGTPIIVLTDVDDVSQAGRAITAGAYDVLPKSHDDPYLLARSIQTVLTKRKPRTSLFRSAHGDDVHQAQSLDMMNTREAARFPLSLPAILIPILSDGRPGAAIEGVTRDISISGIGLRIPVTQQLSKHRFVLGIGESPLDRVFASCELVHRRATSDGIELGASFLDGDQNPFHPEKLKPAFDPRSCTYRTPLNDVAAMGWLAMGVLQPVLYDYVDVCPDCSAVTSYRQGCPECGSARTGLSRLIHHLACAHVALADDFETKGQLRCPKCRQKNLVVGADFEYFDGPNRCFDCEWSDVALEPIAQCLRCGLRCPGGQADRKELIYYHVDRLDPLAFLH